MALMPMFCGLDAIFRWSLPVGEILMKLSVSGIETRGL
jgi:hypothetical protein